MKAYKGKLTTIASAFPSQTPEARRAYREENRERINAQQRERYATDPEYRAKRQASVKAWDEQNPEKLKEYGRKWRLANPAKVKANNDKYAKTRNLGKRTDDGHIYIFRTDPNGPFKIGYTGRAVKFRVYEAQRDNFHQVEVIYESGFIVNARQLEAELHEMFKDKNVRGEWYDLNKTNIKNLKTFVNKKVTDKK
jgi:hypothetical protein